MGDGRDDDDDDDARRTIAKIGFATTNRARAIASGDERTTKRRRIVTVALTDDNFHSFHVGADERFGESACARWTGATGARREGSIAREERRGMGFRETNARESEDREDAKIGVEWGRIRATRRRRSENFCGNAY